MAQPNPGLLDSSFYVCLGQGVDLERHRDSLGLHRGTEAALILLRISKVKGTRSHPDVPLYGIN